MRDALERGHESIHVGEAYSVCERDNTEIVANGDFDNFRVRVCNPRGDLPLTLGTFKMLRYEQSDSLGATIGKSAVVGECGGELSFDALPERLRSVVSSQWRRCNDGVKQDEHSGDRGMPHEI